MDISGDGGILKEILVEGSGDEYPQKGDKVYVHYVGEVPFILSVAQNSLSDLAFCRDTCLRWVQVRFIPRPQRALLLLSRFVILRLRLQLK